MDELIATSSAGFLATVGFSIDSVTQWMGDNLLKPFIGGGLSVLYSLRWWIIALVVISIIVYFAFRGFRFFRT